MAKAVVWWSCDNNAASQMSGTTQQGVLINALNLCLGYSLGANLLHAGP